MTLLVEAQGLSSGYNGLPVTRDISLHVDDGEIVGLVGPNGAGKSTTLLTLSGILKPLAGEVRVFGKVPSTRQPHLVARDGLAHVAESRNLFQQLTVRENLQLGAHGSRASKRAGIKRSLELFPALEPLLERKAGLLSGGEQQMLALGRAITSNPRLMLLDEMSLGLAPIIVQRLMRTVREVADATGCGVLLVEQHIHLSLEVVDRAYVLSHGMVTMSGTADVLMKQRALLESSYLGDSVQGERPDA